MLKFKPRTVDKYSSTIISPPVGIQHIARICVAPALATLSIQDYTLVYVDVKERTALNLHLGKTSVIKNLNWPDKIMCNENL